MNINKLKGKIVENGLTTEELAKIIGIDRSTLYRKLNAAEEKFTIGDAVRIKEALKLSDEEACSIFLE